MISSNPWQRFLGQWAVEIGSEFGVDGRPANTFLESDIWTRLILADFTSLCDVEGGRSFSKDLDLRIACMFSGADEFREFVETLTSINVRQLRVADFAMEIQHRERVFFKIAPHRFIEKRRCSTLLAGGLPMMR